MICIANISCDDGRGLFAYLGPVIPKKPRKKGRRASYSDAGAILKSARVVADLSQQAVADSLGITRQAYAHYELGNALPPAVDLKTLCELLSIDANTLLGINRRKATTTEPAGEPRPADDTAAASLQRCKGL